MHAGMIAVVTACRIITTKEATEGFASSGLLTVVILYVVSAPAGSGNQNAMHSCTVGDGTVNAIAVLPAKKFDQFHAMQVAEGIGQTGGAHAAS